VTGPAGKRVGCLINKLGVAETICALNQSDWQNDVFPSQHGHPGLVACMYLDGSTVHKQIRMNNSSCAGISSMHTGFVNRYGDKIRLATIPSGAEGVSESP